MMDADRLARFLMTCFFDSGKVLSGLRSLEDASQELSPWNVCAAGVLEDLLASGLAHQVGTVPYDAETDPDTGAVLHEACEVPLLAFTPAALEAVTAMHAAAVSAFKLPPNKSV